MHLTHFSSSQKRLKTATSTLKKMPQMNFYFNSDVNSKRVLVANENQTTEYERRKKLLSLE